MVPWLVVLIKGVCTVVAACVPPEMALLSYPAQHQQPVHIMFSTKFRLLE